MPTSNRFNSNCYDCKNFTINISRYRISVLTSLAITIALWASSLATYHVILAASGEAEIEIGTTLLSGKSAIVVIGLFLVMACLVTAFHWFTQQILPWLTFQQVCISSDVNSLMHIHNRDQDFDDANGCSPRPVLIVEDGRSRTVSRDLQSLLIIPLGLLSHASIIGRLDANWEIKLQGLDLVFSFAGGTSLTKISIPLFAWSDPKHGRHKLEVINQERIATILSLMHAHSSPDHMLEALENLPDELPGTIPVEPSA